MAKHVFSLIASQKSQERAPKNIREFYFIVENRLYFSMTCTTKSFNWPQLLLMSVSVRKKHFGNLRMALHEQDTVTSKVTCEMSHFNLMHAINPRSTQ